MSQHLGKSFGISLTFGWLILVFYFVRILGFASARGRLYSRHPDLFKVGISIVFIQSS